MPGIIKSFNSTLKKFYSLRAKGGKVQAVLFRDFRSIE
jgi:hypothetical protein